MNEIERQLRDLGERTSQEVTYGEVPGRRIVRRARRRRVLSVAVPVLAAVLLATVVYPRIDLGSGGGLGPVNLAAAAGATEGAGTARLDMEFSMEMPGRASTTKGTGEVDFEGARSYVRFTAPEASGAQVFEVLSIGSSTYQRVAGAEPEAKWMKVRTPDGLESTGATPFASLGPTAFLAYLESVSNDITDLGREEMDGVSVTHLRAALDASLFAPAEAAFGMELDLEPMDVWIDDRNRLRRMTFGISTDDITMSITMGLSDFGFPVDIEAPRPEDVTDEPPDSDEWQGLGPVGVESPDGGDFGVSDAFYVYGSDGRMSPNLLVASAPEPFDTLCMQMLPEGTRNVSLVHVSTGRIVATIHKHDFKPVTDTGLSGACMPGGLPEEDGETLVDDPTQYELRLDRKTGLEVIGLTTVDPLD